MKKISVALLAGAIVLGLSACSKKAEENTAGQAAGSVTQTAQDTNAMRLPAEQAEAEGMTKTTVEFSEMEYDFGTVKEGAKVKHTYKVKNTGTAPLKMTQVKPSCGCTASEFSEEEIAPGGEGYVTAEFNSAGRPGMANKTISVTGNFSDGLVKILRLKGEVK